MGAVELPVNQNRQGNQVHDDCRRNALVSNANAGQTLWTSVVFGHGLQDNAPPEIAVDLDVPFIPARIRRIPPPFFFEQLKDTAEKMMPVLSLLIPISAASHCAEAAGAGRQHFVGADN